MCLGFVGLPWELISSVCFKVDHDKVGTESDPTKVVGFNRARQIIHTHHWHVLRKILQKNWIYISDSLSW